LTARSLTVAGRALTPVPVLSSQLAGNRRHHAEQHAEVATEGLCGGFRGSGHRGRGHRVGPAAEAARHRAIEKRASGWLRATIVGVIPDASSSLRASAVRNSSNASAEVSLVTTTEPLSWAACRGRSSRAAAAPAPAVKTKRQCAACGHRSQNQWIDCAQSTTAECWPPPAADRTQPAVHVRAQPVLGLFRAGQDHEVRVRPTGATIAGFELSSGRRGHPQP
jgi:hypothetical protein